MKKVLFILNKHCGLEKTEMFFQEFLINFQSELISYDIELSYVFFSENLKGINVQNKCVYEKEKFIHLTKNDISIHAKRIEKEYKFTFKQAHFADIVQTFKGQNHRKITVPERNFNDLSFLVPRFIFLENLIISQDFDVIFSDISPETEMEFGRVIGNKLNKIVLKSSEGSALGNTVLLQSFSFGKDRLVEAKMNDFSVTEASKFCKDFIENERLPYTRPQQLSSSKSFVERLRNRLIKKDYYYFVRCT